MQYTDQAHIIMLSQVSISGLYLEHYKQRNLHEYNSFSAYSPLALSLNPHDLLS